MGRKSRAKRERRVECEQRARNRKRQREQRLLAAERGAAEGRRRGCLICRQSDGGFTSVEHIVPESLANRELVLPVGVVCDRCNTHCSRLDRELCEFSPIRFMKTAYGVPSKRGKLPRFEFNNGAMWCDGPGEISLALDDEDSSWREWPAPQGQHAFSFTTESSDWTAKRASRVQRALVKQALECAWLDHGERALGVDFDREREIILKGGHRGYLVLPKDVDTRLIETRVDYLMRTRTTDSKQFLFIRATLLGIPLATDSLFPAPVNDVSDDFNLVTF